MQHEEDPSSVAKALHSIFPGITIDYKLGKADAAFWARYLRQESGPVTLGTFITSLLGGFLPPSARTGVKITFFTEGTTGSSTEGGSDISKGIRVRVDTSVPLVAQDSRSFGLVQVYRVVNDGLTIYLESVVAPAQGRSFVKNILLAQARQYRATRLALRASSIGGSQEGVYVWARYGFFPLPEDWNSMRSRGLAALEQRPGLAPVHGPLKEALLDPSPKALRRIVYLSWSTSGIRMEVKGFLDNMLTSGFSWDGELFLTEPESLAWIAAYADERPYQEFEPLLPKISGQQEPPAPKKAEEVKKEKSDEDADSNPFNLSEDQMVEHLAGLIISGDGSQEEVDRDFPHLADKVRARVLELKG